MLMMREVVLAEPPLAAETVPLRRSFFAGTAFRVCPALERPGIDADGVAGAMGSLMALVPECEVVEFDQKNGPSCSGQRHSPSIP